MCARLKAASTAWGVLRAAGHAHEGRDGPALEPKEGAQTDPVLSRQVPDKLRVLTDGGPRIRTAQHRGWSSHIHSGRHEGASTLAARTNRLKR